ncbi:bifunctional N5-glutamine S-adenosyl-L-methionine-dependent methyltransferase/tRNA (m7G46) methyltransferase [compost metagenome]
MTIKDLLIKGMTMLKLEGIESPKLKSRLLLQHVLDKPRDYLVIYDREEVEKKYEKK